MKQLARVYAPGSDGDLVLRKTKIHCIGFSLGAHVCSFACKQLSSQYNYRCSRLTALDPAALRFRNKGPEERISKEDADFVDVYHSSTVGLRNPFGHTDFYINDLELPQPGCSTLSRTSFGPCSHMVAPRYFAKSLRLGPKPSTCFSSDHCLCNSTEICANGFSSCRLVAGYFTDTTVKAGRVEITDVGQHCMIP